MPDIFSTNALVAQVEDLRSRPPTNPTLLSQFFPRILEEESEEIHFDVESKPRRIAPFVHPTVEGRIVENQGFSTKTFSPAYIKDKRQFNPRDVLSRTMGEPIGGNLSADQRRQRLVAASLADQIAMIRRRKELMAAEALRLGTVTVDGDGYDTVVVNYGRDSNLSVDLSGGAAEWDDSGISPVANVETWTETALRIGGSFLSDWIFTPGAWTLFRADTAFEKAVDLRRGGSDNVEFSMRPQTGMTLMGTMGARRLWLYFGWYVNDAGSEVAIIPDNTVLGVGDVMGAQCHGAILDEENLQAMEFWPKSWVQQDPSVRFLMLQSAPLVVPFRPNATFSAIVT